MLTNGQIACWGYNGDGEIGDLTTNNHLTPVTVNLGTDVAQAVGAGYSHTCVLTAALGIWCWGYNGFGEIGDGTNNDALGPPKVLLQ